MKKSYLFPLIFIAILCFACEKEDVTPEEPTTTTTPQDTTTNDTSAVSAMIKNAVVDGTDTIKLNEYLVGRLNTGNNNLGYQLQLFNQLTPRTNGYWIIGLHHIPKVDTTYESSFTYHWQNIPDGKFYFNSIQDMGGQQMWYTNSETIQMQVTVEGDLITMSCSNIEVGDSFLPTQVNNRKTVSTSATVRMSDLLTITSVSQGVNNQFQTVD